VLKAQPTEQSLSLHNSQALLSIAQILAPCRDLDELLWLLAPELSKIIAFDDLSSSVWDAGTGAFKLRISSLSDAPDHTPPIEFTASGPVGAAFETGQPIVIRDARDETRFASATAMMHNAAWLGLCHWPLVSRQRRLGTLNLASRTPLNIDSREMELVGEVARLVTVAVQNAIDFDAVNSRRVELEGDRDRLRMVLDVNNALVSSLDLQALFRSLASSMSRVLGHMRTTLALYDEQIGNLVPFAFETGSGASGRCSSAALSGHTTT
jgi:formate hydrogenlyase transcriptional activator